MNSKNSLLIVVFILVSLALSQLFQQSFLQSTEGKNLDQGKSEEENEFSILDMFSRSPGIGDTASDFTSEDVHGNKVSLSDFENKKPVLLVFWATWCNVCIEELPDLRTFTQDYQDQIQVIVIASGETKETIKDYIQEKDINFLMALDEKREIWNQYLVRGTPSHFLINSSREIVTLNSGLLSMRDFKVMMSMLAEL